MRDRFSISFSSSTFEGRPPLSHKVRVYVSSVIEKFLFERGIISLKTGWKIDLVMMFMEETPRLKMSEIILGKGFKSVGSEKVRIYHMFIPFKLVDSSSAVFEDVIEVLKDALAIFFVSLNKKITMEIMEECWQELDMKYLRSIPYPAPLVDQKFVGDMVREDGSISRYNL